MPDKQDDEITCTLCRSGRQSKAILTRARKRKINWPAAKEHPIIYDKGPQIQTTIDEVFSSVLQYMSVTSRQCRRYFKCSAHFNVHDQGHVERFHKPEYTTVTYGNPAVDINPGLFRTNQTWFDTNGGTISKNEFNELQKSEDIQVELVPGTYAVSAGQCGVPRSHTQVVRLDPGQTVDLTFTCR